MPRRLLTDYLDDFLSHGDEIAYVQKRGYRTVRCSYREVAETAFQFARELESRGIMRGDRVLIWGENSAQWVAAFLGCVLRGVAAVPMDRAADPEFVLRVHDQVASKLIVASRDLALHAEGMQPIALEDLAQIVARHPRTPYAHMDITADDAVEIVFTSGTTAEPKGVVISHRNILASLDPLETEIARYRKYERFFHPIRFLNLLPLSHVFGQFLGIFIPQLIQGNVVFQESLNPTEIIETIKREHISVVVSVPRVLEALKDKLLRDAEARHGSGSLEQQIAAASEEKILRRFWRFRHIHRRFGWRLWALISGGAALGEDTEEFWRRLGYAVIQGYGMTESTSLISVNHPFKLGRRSIGKVLPGRELKLDEHGEILVRGENIARSYWVGKRLEPVAGKEGWLRTGDLGALDENGNLFFVGRKKNVIVTAAGMNIYPEDIEAVIKRQPEVRDAVVVGFAQGGNAEPAAAIIPASRTNAHASLERAIEHANNSLAEYQRVRRWIEWPEEDFPRTPTQKVRTNIIAQTLAARFTQTALQRETPQSGTLAELIARITKRNTQVLSSDARLEDDLNLSSLDRIELMSAIEDRYLVDVDESTFAHARTVADLERLVHAKTPTDRTPYPYATWQQHWPLTWIRRAIYYLLTLPATLLMAKPQVIGREHLRGVSGPALIVSNHVTMADIGFLMYALPSRFRDHLAVAMQGEMLRAMRFPSREWNPMRRWFEQWQWLLVTALFNVQPLPQLTDFRESFERLGDSADHGYSIVVFPEGKRTTTGQMNPFRSGIGILAQRLQLPVIPMRIDGLFPFAQGKKHIVPPNAITVRIGPPISFSGDGDAETIARELQNIVASLQ